MRKIHVIMGIVTAVLMFFTLICGLWMHSTYPGQVVPESSIQFHMWIGAATAISLLVTVVSLFFKKKQA